MPQPAQRVTDRLEHIENVLRDISGTLATLLERSQASATAMADIRVELKALTDGRNADQVKLAELPQIRRDLDGLGGGLRGHETRIGSLERELSAATVRGAGMDAIFARVANVIQALILAAIMWLFTTKADL